jgi:hypothetical protein
MCGEEEEDDCDDEEEEDDCDDDCDDDDDCDGRSSCSRYGPCWGCVRPSPMSGRAALSRSRRRASSASQSSPA